MKKYLIAISAALAILLAGCGEESSQDIDNKPNNIDVQENPKVEEQPVVETPKEQKVEEKDKERIGHIIIKNRRLLSSERKYSICV